MNGIGRTLLAVATYPLMCGGSVVFCLWALARGWPAWAVGAVVVGVTSVLVDLLERVIPYSRTWAKPRGDLNTDVFHYFLSNRAFDIGSIAAIAALTPTSAWLSARLGIGLWPHHWPLGIQAVLALAVMELPWYWVHRLEHTWRPLWRIHSVHHSSTRIYWWNLARNHPLDNLISAVLSMAPITVLGAGERPLALVAAYAGAHAMLQHANIDLRTGVLDVFFTTARVHRWHHSPRIAESNANYGPTITLWDWVFGTRWFEPDVAPPEDVGLAPLPAPYPQGFLGQMRAPFERRLWGP
jgi:sterol desaturase/sphingolipid hydroxylase (fatty acid hydroxylase superfamily)